MCKSALDIHSDGKILNLGAKQRAFLFWNSPQISNTYHQTLKQREFVRKKYLAIFLKEMTGI